MGILNHLFWQAEPEELASFCNEEGHHVENMNAFNAEVAHRTAQASGAETSWWDYIGDVNDRFNRVIYEKENDLVIDDEFNEAKYRPGK
ncbi:MAG: hypothetical protein AAF827_03910 [Cyanobacteria bacterium P01_D01_bin.6]